MGVHNLTRTPLMSAPYTFVWPHGITSTGRVGGSRLRVFAQLLHQPVR